VGYSPISRDWSLEHRRVHADLTEVFKIFQGLSINQSINLYLSQAKAHTNTHAHTHTQKTTTMYNKRNKKETVEKKHIYIVRCQIQLTFLTRLFTEQY